MSLSNYVVALVLSIIIEISVAYLMGYKERDRYLDQKYYDYIFDRSGNATNSIIVDGVISGVWDVYEKPKPIIKLYFFKKQNKEIMDKLISIEKKIERKSKIGRLDFLFAIGVSCVLASLPMMFIEKFRDSIIPYLFLVMGVLLMIGTNYIRERV